LAALIAAWPRALVVDEVAANLAAERVTSAHADAVVAVAEGIDTAHDITGIIGTSACHRALPAVVIAPAVQLACTGDPFCGAEASNGSGSIPDQDWEDSNVELHCDVTSTWDH